MKTAGIILFTLIYYATLFVAGIWYDVKAVALVLLACCCVGVVVTLLEKDGEKNEQS